MNSILKEPFQQGRVQQNINDEIESISNDSSALLVDFLSGVLTLSHTKKAIFSEAIFSVLNDNYFKAEVHGNSCDGFDEDIKAVTYGETNIVLNMDGLYESVILFDI